MLLKLNHWSADAIYICTMKANQFLYCSYDASCKFRETSGWVSVSQKSNIRKAFISIPAPIFSQLGVILQK